MNRSRALVTVERPIVTGRDARAELLRRAVRPTVPLRKTFVQALPGGESRRGPLQTFVSNGDLRGLRAYLVVVAATSASNEDGWSTTFDSLVWARLLDAEETATQAGARTAAWRTLGRLQDRRLIRRARSPRSNRDITVTLLREDGHGDPYTHPAAGPAVEPADRYLRLPVTFWTKGFDAKLTMPGLAMLLTLAREKPWSAFPAERMPKWYGWSPDTTERGLRELLDLDLAERRAAYRRTPLSPRLHPHLPVQAQVLAAPQGRRPARQGGIVMPEGQQVPPELAVGLAIQFVINGDVTSIHYSPQTAAGDGTNVTVRGRPGGRRRRARQHHRRPGRAGRALGGRCRGPRRGPTLQGGLVGAPAGAGRGRRPRHHRRSDRRSRRLRRRHLRMGWLDPVSRQDAVVRCCRGACRSCWACR